MGVGGPNPPAQTHLSVVPWRSPMNWSSKAHLLQFFFFGYATWHAELLRPGIEPVPSAVEVRSVNHWTTREVPTCSFHAAYSRPYSAFQ